MIWKYFMRKSVQEIISCVRRSFVFGGKSVPGGALRRFYAGYDPSKINDRSAFCLLEKMDDGSLETRMLINLQGLDYKAQVQEIIRICKNYGVLCLAIDSTGHEAVYEELRDGLGRGKVRKVVFTKQVKEDLVLNLRMLVQERKIKLARQLRFYDVLRKELHDLLPDKLDHPKGGSSDLFWALALAAFASVFNYIKAKKIFIPNFMER